MGQIAFLMLMGVVMKNGILLVDYTNTLRARGRSLSTRCSRPARRRMRPVLMTTVSTVCSMLPVAFGTGDGSEWRSPMGIISIGGLLTSTFLTLLVVPVVYTLVDDAGRVVRSMVGRGLFWKRRTARATESDAPQNEPGPGAYAAPVPDAATTFGGPRVVICPATGQPEEIELDAARAAVTTAAGASELRVERCSHWPAGGHCDQGCVRGVDPRWAREHGLLTAPRSSRDER